MAMLGDINAIVDGGIVGRYLDLDFADQTRYFSMV
jgi:hypothetical protein